MNQYTDERDNVHVATEKIGDDGQGSLYYSKNKGVLIRAGKPQDAKAWRDASLLPLGDAPHLLLPAGLFKAPQSGYILRVPEGFVPLSQATDNGKTGGMKRRLGWLINLAKLLIRLHAMPVAYGGFSPERIWVSEDARNTEVYLLYSAQLSFSRSFTESGDPYCAPETRAGRGGSVSGDVYAFAALARDILTDFGAADPPPGELGEWIDRALQAGNPWERPRLPAFYEGLRREREQLTDCKKCRADVRYDAEKCPGCGTPLHKQMIARIYDVVSETRIARGVSSFEVSQQRQFFQTYHTGNPPPSETPGAAIEFILAAGKDRKFHLIFKNQLPGEIRINDKALGEGQCVAVAVPFRQILIQIQNHAYAKRIIELTIR